MSTCSKCGLAFCVACLCLGGAIAAGEAFDISRPSDFVCFYQRAHNDFGPPAGCGEGPGQHSRQGWMTSVASTSSTTVHSGIFNFVDAPTVAFTAHDAEDASERTAAYDRRVSLMLGSSLFGNDGGTIYLIKRPDEKS
jgi:hypothetical protein